MTLLPAPQSLTVFDARPFFEKALVYGIQHGLIDDSKLAAMSIEAPKGIVQIARYFGTEFLRPDLERARDRMVNLVSLYLESTTSGDLHQAAVSLRDHSLLSRSKGGSDMLKALIAMPQNSHFGMNDRGGFKDEHIPLLGKWTLRSLAEYQTELNTRGRVAHLVEAAKWFGEALQLDEDALEEYGGEAEAVIRSGIMTLALGRSEMPDWPGFEKMWLAIRKKSATRNMDALFRLPKDLPPHFSDVVEPVRQSLIADAPKVLMSVTPLRKLFDHTPAFMGRYFWLEDAIAEMDDYERQVSHVWEEATNGATDDSSLLTVFLCLATGSATKTSLTERTAATLVRKCRKSGIDPEKTLNFIENHAPADYRADYQELWQEFIAEAQPTLLSDFDYTLKDALNLLRRECNVAVSRT
jgi:hypothetical protein